MILRPATRGDCLELSATLRECDRQEIALGSGRSPFTVLWDSVSRSDFSETIETPGGDVAGIWGVVPTPNASVGSIWMLGSNHLESVSIPFLKASAPSIAKAHARYPTLMCASWRGNALHHKWLQWLGFTPMVGMSMPDFIPFFRHV